MENAKLKDLLKKADKRFTEDRYGSSYHDMMTDYVYEAVVNAWDSDHPEKELSKETLLQWSLQVAFDGVYFLQLMKELKEDISDRQRSEAS